MSEDFSNNPFTQLGEAWRQALDDQASLAGDKSNTNKQVRTQGMHFALGERLDEEAEKNIFLQAMTQKSSGHSGLDRGKAHCLPLLHSGGQGKGGFSLEDVGALKKLRERDVVNKKSKQGATGTKARQKTGNAAPAPTVCQKAQQNKTVMDAVQPSMEEIFCTEDMSVIPAPGTADEQAFWRAMQQVQPLVGKGRDVPLQVQPSVPLQQAENALQDFMDGKLEFALSLTGEYLEGHVVGLDDMIMNKLRAGQYSPEAHCDLHSLNTLQAFQALLGFFRRAWYKGLRTVLVVPGRGRNSPDGIAILREKLQLWLTQEPFKRVVLAFCTARPADGGPGSVYVLLRKYRKKGKIRWERMPSDPDLY